MSNLATDVAALTAAFVLAAVGGELFLRGVVAAADRLRLPPAVVATTVAAFVTSAPEFLVSVVAAVEARPAVGLGDALGSNVVNVALILGLVLTRRAIHADPADHRLSAALALAVPFLSFLFFADGHLRRWEGALLLAVFAVWVAAEVVAGLRRRPLLEAAAATVSPPSAAAWPPLGLGLILLVLAGRFFVAGAGGLAARFGIDDYVIGATVVAIGTSLPELAMVLVSRRRGHDDIGLGTLLGSNLFNGLAIVGTVAVIRPIDVPLREIGVTLALGWASVLLAMPQRNVVPRSRAVWLLAVFAVHVIFTLAVARGG